MPANLPKKHHYIPVFFLRNWVTHPDGKICQYFRPREDLPIVCTRKHPDATGYEINLNNEEGVSGPDAFWMETHFLQNTDHRASEALKLMTAGDLAAVAETERKTHWSRFIITLLHRNPEKMEWIRGKWRQAMSNNHEEYRRQWEASPGPKLTWEEYSHQHLPEQIARSSINLQKTLMDSEVVGQRFNDSRWSLITVNGCPEPVLTGDRPIVMMTGIPGAILMPISPTQILVMYEKENQLPEVQSFGSRPLVAKFNGLLVSQCKKFVYGPDDAMRGFVERRLGKNLDAVNLATFHRTKPW